MQLDANQARTRWPFRYARLAVLLGVIAAPGAALDQTVGTDFAAYDLQPGDVIGLSVAGIPEMTLQAEVQMDGTVSLPQAGEIRVGGRSIADVRDDIRGAISGRVFTEYTSDGREVIRSVEPLQVAVEVSQYRPIYVEGAVVQPGELTFRPGMTVRQAVAAAGGAAPAAAEGTDATERQRDFSQAWFSLAQANLHVWRLGSEGGQDPAPFDVSQLPCGLNHQGSLDALIAAEARIRVLHQQERVGEHAFLGRTIEQIDQHIAVLRKQLEAERATEEADNAMLIEVNDESRRGLYTLERKADFRDAALSSTTRRLQTESALMRLEQRRTEIDRDRDRFDEQTELKQMTELSEAQIQLAQARLRFDAAYADMLAAGIAPSPSARVRLKFVITHGSKGEQISAGSDASLWPGDVVTVTFGSDWPIGETSTNAPSCVAWPRS